MGNLYEIDKLNEVWNRVVASSETETTTASPYSDKTALCSFIEDEANDCDYYKRLAAKCGKNGKALFNRIANDEYGHMKRLQREYFILTGDSHTPEIKRTEIGPILSALRLRYLAENEGQMEYENAAEHTKNHRLSKLFNELATDEAKHAADIGCLIDKALN